MENKQKILERLCKTLKETREYRDLKSIKYVTQGSSEYAVLTFPDETYSVCITADSGIAVIRDVMRFLEKLEGETPWRL